MLVSSFYNASIKSYGHFYIEYDIKIMVKQTKYA